MGTTETSITNRIQEMEERISGVVDTIEKIDSLAKENIKSNRSVTQNIHKIRDTKPRNNKARRRRRTPAQRQRKYIQQNHRRKFSQPKEGYAYEDTRSLHKTN